MKFFYFQFILYYKNQPLFVEAGTSTYQVGEVRNTERSTMSHNTVAVNGMNQSQVWSGFRVARRAKTLIFNNTSTSLSAEHDGYKNLKINHRRVYDFEDDFFKINDHLLGDSQKIGDFFLHIFPGLKVEKINDQIKIQNEIVITFSNFEQIDLLDYEMANGYACRQNVLFL